MNSLLKYENPVLITTDGVKKSHSKQPSVDTSIIQTTTATTSVKKVPPILHSDDVIAAILPPKEWEEDGKLWVQKVSSTPSTRLDVIALQEQLDSLLQKQQARETGICPIRRELYDQCFDEIIRHVAVSCQERGLLLLRVRDELRMTLMAYQTLYESSIAFGMRKALSTDEKQLELEKKEQVVADDMRQMQDKIAELQQRIETMEKREVERHASDEKKHAEEVSMLKKTNAQLKAQLESILNPSGGIGGASTAIKKSQQPIQQAA